MSSTTSARPSWWGRSRRHSRRAPVEDPKCGCCGTPVDVVGMDVTRNCVCDPDDDSCPFCGRLPCHCACKRKVKFAPEAGK